MTIFAYLFPETYLFIYGEQNETYSFVREGQERKIFYPKILPPRDCETAKRGGSQQSERGQRPP